jgi:hypothetical protein
MFKGEAIQSTSHTVHFSENQKSIIQPNWASVMDLLLMGHFLVAPFLFVGDASVCPTRQL